jgi:hypothetical protein
MKQSLINYTYIGTSYKTNCEQYLTCASVSSISSSLRMGSYGSTTIIPGSSGGMGEPTGVVATLLTAAGGGVDGETWVILLGLDTARTLEGELLAGTELGREGGVDGWVFRSTDPGLVGELSSSACSNLRAGSLADKTSADTPATSPVFLSATINSEVSVFTTGRDSPSKSASVSGISPSEMDSTSPGDRDSNFC